MALFAAVSMAITTLAIIVGLILGIIYLASISTAIAIVAGVIGFFAVCFVTVSAVETILWYVG